jgi:hypothetical protein
VDVSFAKMCIKCTVHFFKHSDKLINVRVSISIPVSRSSGALEFATTTTAVHKAARPRIPSVVWAPTRGFLLAEACILATRWLKATFGFATRLRFATLARFVLAAALTWLALAV